MKYPINLRTFSCFFSFLMDSAQYPIKLWTFSGYIHPFIFQKTVFFSWLPHKFTNFLWFQKDSPLFILCPINLRTFLIPSIYLLFSYREITCILFSGDNINIIQFSFSRNSARPYKNRISVCAPKIHLNILQFCLSGSWSFRSIIHLF